MSDERLEAIRERLNTRGGYSKTAYFDIDYLLDRIEVQREVVEAAREAWPIICMAAAACVDSGRIDPTDEPPADSYDNAKAATNRLREALDNLEEQTDE